MNGNNGLDDRLFNASPGGYRLIKALGEGGYGQVYLAYDERLNRYVAAKYFKPRGSNTKKSFQREVDALIKVPYTYIVQILNKFEYGMSNLEGSQLQEKTQAPHYFIILEYIEGGSLQAAIYPNQIQGEQLDLAFIFYCMDQISKGLAFVHSKGCLHLDIKPGNILLKPSGSTIWPTCLLADFGIAQFLNSGERLRELRGTQPYIAPEIWRITDSVQNAESLSDNASSNNVNSIDQRADIYSLGIMMYELVVGKLPFVAINSADMSQKHLHEKPRRPSDEVLGLPKEWDRVILKAIEKNPDLRYQTAEEFNRELQQLNTKSLTPFLPNRISGPEFNQLINTIGIKNAPPISKVTIQVRDPYGNKQPVTLDKPINIIGSGEDTDITLNKSENILPQHVKVILDARGASVQDITNSGTTWIDGKPLTNEQEDWPLNAWLQLPNDYSFLLEVITMPLESRTVKPRDEVEVIRALQEHVRRPSFDMRIEPSLLLVNRNTKSGEFVVRFTPDEYAPPSSYEVKISAPGLPNDLFDISPLNRQIQTGEIGEIRVLFRHEDDIKQIKAKAGLYDVAIEISPKETHIAPQVQIVRIRVEKIRNFSFDFEPKLIENSGDHTTLTVTNNSNYDSIFHIHAKQMKQLRISPVSKDIGIAMGAGSKPIRLQFKYKGSRATTLGFEVEVKEADERQVKMGTFKYNRPYLSFLQKILIIVLAVLVASTTIVVVDRVFLNGQLEGGLIRIYYILVTIYNMLSNWLGNFVRRLIDL